MIRCVFDHNMRRLIEEEIVKETNAWCHAHIASIRRPYGVLMMNDLNLVSVATKEIDHHFGGKIIIKKRNTRREQVCCTMDETTTSFSVVSRGNKEICLPKPLFSINTKPMPCGPYDECSGYRLDILSQSDYETTDHCPTRMITSYEALTNLTF